MNVIVPMHAVKQLINETLGGPAQPRVVNELPSEDPPIEPNVTSSAEDTTPALDPPVDDPEFVPANPNELAVAADKLARRVDPTSLNQYYTQLKRLAKAEEEGRLSSTKQKVDVGTVEEQLRKHVRDALISEISPWAGGGLAFSGWGVDPDIEDDDNEEDDDEPRQRRQHLTTKDVEGDTLDSIAKEFGFVAPSGAKAFLFRTMEKFKHLFVLRDEDPAAFDRFIFMAASEYIGYLKSSGELDDEEVELLYSHPELVAELEGFREYLHVFVKRAMRKAKSEAGEDGDE
mgnify:FL=1